MPSLNAVKLASEPMKIATSEALRDTVRELGLIQTMFIYLMIVLVVIVFLLMLKELILGGKTAKALAVVEGLGDRLAENTAAITGMAAVIKNKMIDKPLNLLQTDILYEWGTKAHRVDKIILARPILIKWLRGIITTTEAKLELEPIFRRVTSQEKGKFNSFDTFFGKIGDEFVSGIAWPQFMTEYTAQWRMPTGEENERDVRDEIEADCDCVMKNYIAKIKDGFMPINREKDYGDSRLWE